MFFSKVYSQGILPRIYEYDSGGNRIIRKVIVLNSATQNKDSVLSEFGTETAEENTYYLFEKIDEIKTLVYPNPTTSVIRLLIEADSFDHKGIVDVYTTNGTELQQKHITNTLTDIDLSSYPKGIYILRLRIGEEQREWKIIKE